MKNLLTFSLVVVVAFLGSGCSKSGTSSPYGMTATVNNKSQNFPNCLVDTEGFYVNFRIVIDGLSGNSISPSFPHIMMSIFDPNFKTGTFSFDSSLTNSFAEYLVSDSSGKPASGGFVTINSFLPQVTGTFSFTCTDGTVVSNGNFTSKIQ